jgi:hypothetical protein
MTNNKIKVLRVEQLTIKVPIQKLVYDGAWVRIIGNTKIELGHVPDGIRLLVNDVLQPVHWQIHERRIAGDISYRGGFIPADRCWVYYLIGRDSRRYRFLYILPVSEGRFRIGTRKDFGAVYSRDCYSRRQRKIARECLLIWLTKRQNAETG